MDVFLLCILPPSLRQSDCSKLFLTQIYGIFHHFMNDTRSLYLSTKVLHISEGLDYNGMEGQKGPGRIMVPNIFFYHKQERIQQPTEVLIRLRSSIR